MTRIEPNRLAMDETLPAARQIWRRDWPPSGGVFFFAMNQADKFRSGKSRGDRAEAVRSPAGANRAADDKLHARSHAAHRDSGAAEPHPKPAGNLQQGSYPGGRKEP